jgi:hypothetical protein
LGDEKIFNETFWQALNQAPENKQQGIVKEPDTSQMKEKMVKLL